MPEVAFPQSAADLKSYTQTKSGLYFKELKVPSLPSPLPSSGASYRAAAAAAASTIAAAAAATSSASAAASTASAAAPLPAADPPPRHSGGADGGRGRGVRRRRGTQRGGARSRGT